MGVALHCVSISRGLSGYQTPHLDSIALKTCVFVQAYEGPAPADSKMLWISLTSDLSRFTLVIEKLDQLSYLLGFL